MDFFLAALSSSYASCVSSETFSCFVEGSLTEEGDKSIVNMMRKKTVSKVGAGKVSKLFKIYTLFPIMSIL